jgi:hypothetical protein
MAYQDIIYPAALDTFREVVDGVGPNSLIAAELPNKIQNALTAIERRTQYTPTTPYATGSIMYVAKRAYTLPNDLDDPGLRLAVNVTLDAGVCSQYFQGSPFNRAFCVFPSCVGYKIVNGARVYFPVRAGINAVQENGSVTCQVNCVKDDKWKKNHVAEITLMVVNPGLADCPLATPTSTGCAGLGSGLLFWYKADAITGVASGARLTGGWVDSSGNGYDLQPPSVQDPPFYVTNVQNGLPAVRILHDFEYLRLPGGSFTSIPDTSLTFYLVFNPQTPQTGNAHVLTSFQSAGEDLSLFCDRTSGLNQVVGFDTDTGGTVNTGTALTGWQVLTWKLDKAAATGTVYRDGLAIGSGAFPSIGVDLGPDEILFFTTGAANFLHADVGEMIGYTDVHDDTSLQNVINCLLTKWGIVSEN